eukprot:gene2560-3170_t
MFERTLIDLIRGIRNHKKNETKFINQCIHEIKDELKGDAAKKALAVQKLTYIAMLGYDIGWASFNIVEVMSSPKYAHKRIGYLAASQTFHEGTEVIMLATHQIRKDFQSPNPQEAYLALNCLSNICTPDLARDLANDLLGLLSTQKTHILKRSVSVMYKIFLKYPDSLRPSFPKLKEKLEDPEPSVVSCAVNVICELARKNPKNYLSLAPTLFRILTNSSTNYWMLIKIVKLFAALTPLEPRLGKKLVDPLTNIINSSSSMSLLFECIQTCITGMSDHIPLMKLCISRLRMLIEHKDQNLKYLGLLALNNIMQIHPKAVSEHRDLVLSCLDDEDISIRQRALDLLAGMTNKKNLQDIVAKLLDHVEIAEGTYKDKIIEKIVELCALGTYQYITDFEWYINVLVRLSQIQETVHGKLIASQFLDVIIRVRVIRTYGTKQMIELLKSPRLMSNPTENGICEVLYAAAWIVGEFSSNINQPVEALEAFLQPRVSVLPAHIQSIYMQNALKVFSNACAIANGHEIPEDAEQSEITSDTLDECLNILNSRLPLFTQSIHLEVQERACLVNEILKFYSATKDQGNNIAEELISLFTEQLNPVGPKAQKKVPVPEGLDLDEWINDPKLQEPEESSDSDSEIFNRFDEEERESRHHHISKEEMQRLKDERMRKQANNPYMLGGRSSSKASPEQELAPVMTLPENLGPVIVGSKLDSKSKKPKPKKYVIDTTTEMPEGAKDSDSDNDKKKRKGLPYTQDALSQINLDEPLGANDVLPVNRHRTDIIKEREREASRLARSSAAASIGNKPTGGSPSGPYEGLTSPPPSDKKSSKKSSKSSSKSKKSSSESKSKSSSTTTTSKKTTTPTVLPPPTKPAPAKKPANVFLPLLDDEFFKVTYDVSSVPDQDTQVKIVLKLMNKSDEDMIDTTVTFDSNANGNHSSIKATGGEIGLLEAGASATYTQIVGISSETFITNQIIAFNLNATPSASSEPVKQLLNVEIPTVNFIRSTKLKKDQFADILQKSDPMFLGSAKVSSGGLQMNDIINKLQSSLSIEVVQAHPNGTTASFYAKTIFNHHIAMLVKERDGTVSFDIKTSDSGLSTLIIKEINSLFSK